MATTLRSDPETTQTEDEPEECRFCHGKLSIIVSRDPDEEADCVCVDPPVLVEPPVWRGEHV